ncbi:DUF885 domain-containing protein [Mucilaginibacter roseus]|uniref:DUF885 domain-containing protein n=1 Tax=Mucilaginibacter roseus TaxID=1528868 RepID=A0ABS8TY64_9SPHI|nr:DUF885 family protein [Mucilaginibacter roseus]MCD8739811.1 DUF885 domain-containing protein [Mucilaginibacter roseus]
MDKPLRKRTLIRRYKNKLNKTGKTQLALWTLLALAGNVYGQSHPSSVLYDQTSELAGPIIQYEQDIDAIRDFYLPYEVNERSEYQFKVYVLNSPEQRSRLLQIDSTYLADLKKVDFRGLSIYGQADYLMLKKEIAKHVKNLSEENTRYDQIKIYLSFADDVYALEKKRRRGEHVDGEEVAKIFSRLAVNIANDSAKLSNVKSLDKPLANTLGDAASALKARLKSFFDFYNTYDPAFTWWVPVPYKKINGQLSSFTELASSKGKISTTQKDDGSGIKGKPIGRKALIAQLNDEFIPYTPEELIELANKEFAWCDKEMLKASRQMGFGDDWKKALEKVKNSYMPLGHQPELIVKLYNDAIDFIKARDLITVPPLAEETWGMVMMSPKRQLVNPFFTGGKEISISYPTNSMAYDDRLMSMRGNNPYFSRGTVQHELIPGHNLQYFMNSRYKPYRHEFSTPFSTEGWALYWEMLLWDQGFAQKPEERVGMLFWRMHRCARIIFSMSYHLNRWTPQQCIDFLVDRVGHERANAEGEVRRSFEGGYSPLYQVAYLLGGLQYMALKHEMVDSGKMTYKQFHDAAIKENLIPVEMLRAILTKQQLDADFETKWRFYNIK